jgi:hypothetical protein
MPIIVVVLFACLFVFLPFLKYFKYWYELFLDDLPMWGMVGETLRDDAHGRMEKVTFIPLFIFLPHG